MKRIRLASAMLLLAAATRVSLAAQSRPVAPPANVPPPAAAPTAEAPSEPYVWRSEVLRIGQDLTLAAGDRVREVVVIAGDTTIDGRVDQDVVVVLGKARLSSTAVIGGSLVVVGGSAGVISGARVEGDLVVVGAGFEAPPGFMPGGQQIIVGPNIIGGRLEGLVPWFARGLLLGRPIVPDLSWVWGIVGLVFLVYLAITLLFHKPVQASAETLARRPLTSLVVGLLVMLLTGPLCLLLAVSVFGILVIPFVICALLVGWIIGRVAVVQWIGRSIVRRSPDDSRFASLLPFAVGFAIITIAYMVPVIGFITWTMVGVFGLGAAALSALAAYRHENPPAPRARWFAPRRSAAAVEPAAATVLTGAEPAPPPSFQDEGAGQSDVAAPATAFIPGTAPPPGFAAPDLASFPHARFWDRLAAFALDVILVLVVRELLDLSSHDNTPILLLLVYHVGFWTWMGTTLGGIICQLRVVRVDGAPLGFADALVRGLSGIFSLAVVGLGGLWILKDPERQAWHDRIAGTYVVKVPRNWPI